ncbi:peptide deformylase [Clostridium sardiniense]|uniref:peptide deformylase n=1 Tax=Clostridium sardiniense TaxID=29369 RepID=UPI00195CFBDA|nr:peptide deformylase [Clostridium sardiniense]MBM7835111.1 peptide deformylase [Clostridium sardiniense]
MAIRKIRLKGDEVLRKNSKVVDKIDNRTLTLIGDMIDTMYEEDGVGLAAPQVGILKRIFVIDVYDGEGARVFINPEILETSGSQYGEEGCLSVPGEFEDVERANYVKVKALNEKGEEFILEGEELLARAILHENDHLNGILFIDKVK